MRGWRRSGEVEERKKKSSLGRKKCEDEERGSDLYNGFLKSCKFRSNLAPSVNCCLWAAIYVYIYIWEKPQ